jgi:phospholipid transport system transporter-binding protein
MSATLVWSEQQQALLLMGQLDFASVPGLRPLLAPHLKRTTQLVIDLTGVERSNSAALALLLQWLEDALDRKCELHYRNLPATLLDIAALHGVAALLPIRA